MVVDNTEALEKNKQWCKTTEIKATPTIFINGRKLPKPYQIEDINTLYSISKILFREQ
jgi:hypothetical protein